MSAIYQRQFIADAKGKPVDNGKVYIGVAYQDPEVQPISAFWDEAMTQPAAQPITISAGYIWNAGSRADIFLAANDYSLRLRDKLGNLIDYIATTGIRTGLAANRSDMATPLGFAAGTTIYLTEAGREGTFVWDASIPIATHHADAAQGVYVAPSPSANGAWVRRSALQSNVLQASWFGVSAASPDNSSAFQSLNTFVASCKRTTPLSSNRAGGVIVELPAGDLTIKTAKALLDSTAFGVRTVGLKFVGKGSAITAINYQPTTAGPLIYNNDYLLDLAFEGITFSGTVAPDASGASDWMYSYNNSGGAQGLQATDCTWQGTWKFGVNLQGLNNNSEHSYFRCGFFGTWVAWQFSPALGGGGSDQFVNYWYSHCRYWCGSPWIDMAAGGHVHLQQCDVSGYRPTSPITLFRFLGQAHAYGVCSFTAKQCRFELRGQYSGVLYCQWPQGRVHFDDCDMSSQNGLGVASFTGSISGNILTVTAVASGSLDLGSILNAPAAFNTRVTAFGTGTGGVGTYTVDTAQTLASTALTAQGVHAGTTPIKFEPGNSPGPQISFDGCQLLGQIEFVYYGNTFGNPRRVSFRDTMFMSFKRYSDALIFTGPVGGGANFGGIAPVRGENCRVDLSQNIVPDFDLNWNQSDCAMAPLKNAPFTIPTGTRPKNGNPATLRLYQGARVEEIILRAKSGHVFNTTTGAVINIKSNGAVIATYTVAGQYGDGFDTVLKPDFEVLTQAQEDITCECSATSGSSSAVFMLRYR